MTKLVETDLMWESEGNGGSTDAGELSAESIVERSIFVCSKPRTPKTGIKVVVVIIVVLRL